MTGRLEGRVAIVTGASQGLGRGIAEAFVREGAAVVNFDRIEPKDSLPGSDWVEVDVAEAAVVKHAVDDVVNKYGKLDVLVNNAGIAPVEASRLIDNDDHEIDRVLAVNVRGVVNGLRAAIPYMQESGGGRVINTASQLGKYGKADWAVYSASKFAVVGLTQSVALEHAKDNIVVNAICPGTFRTPLVEATFGAFAERAGESTDAFIERYAEQEIAFGRMGNPRDMGHLAVFLASEECSFTTGAAFNLTGGEAVFA